MFDDMPIEEVVWDEEIQRMVDQHGLLKELAQGGCHVGEKKFMLKAPVTLNRVVHEVPSHVLWDDEFVHGIQSHGSLLNSLAHGEFSVSMDSKPITELVTSEALVSTMVGSVDLFDERPVWDDDPQFDNKPLHDLDWHVALMQKETQLDKCLNVDNKEKVDLVINDWLTHSRYMDTSDSLFTDMPLEVIWDEEMLSDTDTHESLSVDDEKTNHSAKLNADVVLIPVSTSCQYIAQEFDNFPGKVVAWEDELLHSLDSQDDLLQHLATGEEREVSTESDLNDLLTPVNDQFSMLVTGMDSMHDVFVQFVHSVQSQFSLYDYRTALTMLHECKQDGIVKEFAAQDVCKEMVGDEEQLHGLDLQAGLLQQGVEFIEFRVGEKRILVAGPTKDDMFLNHRHLQFLPLGRDVLYEAFIEISFEEKVAAKAKQGDSVVQVLLDEMPCEDVVWEETSTNLAVPEGLLQQLTLGKEYMNVSLVSEIVWTEYILYDLETYGSLLQQEVIGAADMENEGKNLMVKLIEDEMLPDIDIFQLLQEHGIEVADQMLEHMQQQLVAFKAQVLSECDAHKHVTQFAEYLVDGYIKPLAVMEHLYHICYGACSGHEMKCDCNHLVIFDGEQGVCGGAHYVASVIALWRRSALSPGNSDTKATCSVFNKILSWNRSGFSPGESGLQLALYMMLVRQWDPSCKMVLAAAKLWQELLSPWKSNSNQHCSEKVSHSHILNSTKLVLIVCSSRRDASEFMSTATLGIPSSHSSRDKTELCAWYFKFIVELDEHHIDVSSLQKDLGLQTQHHLSTNRNEKTIVLKEVRLSLALYVISWCTVLKYRAFKCQNLSELYKFKQDDTRHGEDILQASVLNQFLTWTRWRGRSHNDANCAADLIHEDMIFGVLIINNLAAGKRCFSLLINDSLCISILHFDVGDSLIILSIICPWDPGGVKSFLTSSKESLNCT